MILFILLCFLAPGSRQQTHAAHEIKAQKQYIISDVEDDNEDEDENESAYRKLRQTAANSTALATAPSSANPDQYKNAIGFLPHLHARYIFHGTLRI